MKRQLIPAAFAVAAALLTTPVHAASYAYTVGDLGSLANLYYSPTGHSAALALNNLGQAAGFYQGSNGIHAPAQTHAFYYTGAPGVDGVMTDLGAFNYSLYPSSQANGINNSGLIVGDGGDGRAFAYTGTPGGPDGKMNDLGTFGGRQSTAAAVNNAGQITGWSTLPGGAFDGPAHAFIATISTDGTVAKTDISPAGYQTYGAAINESGQVAGTAINSQTGDSHGFLYSAGQFTDLGGWIYDSNAYGINDAGQVVGSAMADTDGWSHAFLATVDSHGTTTMSDLGTIGGLSSVAYDINNHGQIVGYGDLLGDTNNGHAFVSQGNHLVDLNTLIDPASGWDLSTAFAINDIGQIVGIGTVTQNQTTYSHAFLLNPAPAPEPSAWAVLGLGGLTLAGLAARRRMRSTAA